jgi:hypothetical protein
MQELVTSGLGFLKWFKVNRPGYTCDFHEKPRYNLGICTISKLSLKQAGGVIFSVGAQAGWQK